MAQAGVSGILMHAASVQAAAMLAARATAPVNLLPFAPSACVHLIAVRRSTTTNPAAAAKSGALSRHKVRTVIRAKEGTPRKRLPSKPRLTPFVVLLLAVSLRQSISMSLTAIQVNN